MANNVQIPKPFDTWYTINQAKEAMQFKHAQYVRKLLHDGKLGEYVEVATDADGVPVIGADGSYTVLSGTIIKLNVGNFERWHIDPAACDDYVARAAAAGGTFGQHAVRRMLFRFSTQHYTVEDIAALLKEHLGDSEVDGEFRWEFTKAWKGGSKKKAKTAKPGETMVASIVASLTQTAPDADDDEFDDEYDEEYDEDDDELEDVLQ